MHRGLVAVFAVLGTGCTAFDFAAPGEAPDASVDAPVDVATVAEGGLDGGAGWLDLAQAAQLCTLVFQCPGLGQAIEGSLVVPVATPPTPLNFSACVDWLAGPIDPGRPGLAQQRGILAPMAQATTCAQAYAASPIHPIDAGIPCKTTSCDQGELETCSTAGAFTTACGAPLFDSPGACTVDSTGLALCVTVGNCATKGLSCSGSSTLVDCYPKQMSYTAFDCTLSGRQCVDQGAAACVVPGSLAAPCLPTRPDDACNGNSVRHCVGSFLGQTEIDCAKVGRTCSTSDGVARCVAPGDLCTPFHQDVNTCDESGISLCVGGRKVAFDCGSLSPPRTCAPADGTHTAHCG